MSYLHLFKLLLAITLFASVIAVPYTNKATNESSDETNVDIIKHFTENDTTNSTEDFDLRSLNPNWKNEVIAISKEVGKEIAKVLVKDISKIILSKL